MKDKARKLTPIFVPDDLRRAVFAVWSIIGNDVEQAAISCGEGLDNESAVESCIDADRLEMYGSSRGSEGKRLSKTLDKLIEEHGYDRVLRALNRECRLV